MLLAFLSARRNTGRPVLLHRQAARPPGMDQRPRCLAAVWRPGTFLGFGVSQRAQLPHQCSQMLCRIPRSKRHFLYILCKLFCRLIGAAHVGVILPHPIHMPSSLHTAWRFSLIMRFIVSSRSSSLCTILRSPSGPVMIQSPELTPGSTAHIKFGSCFKRSLLSTMSSGASSIVWLNICPPPHAAGPRLVFCPASLPGAAVNTWAGRSHL